MYVFSTGPDDRKLLLTRTCSIHTNQSGNTLSIGRTFFFRPVASLIITPQNTQIPTRPHRTAARTANAGLTTIFAAAAVVAAASRTSTKLKLLDPTGLLSLLLPPAQVQN